MNMDMGVTLRLRSVHQLSFSPQFHFITVFHTASVLVMMLGTEVVIQQGVSPVNDPVFFPIIIGVGLLCVVCKMLLVDIADHIGIWRLGSSRARDGGSSLVPVWTPEYRSMVERA